MTRYYGAHVSSAGGLANALSAGNELGVNTIQVHPSAPQRWNAQPFPPEYERAFLEAKGTTSVEKVFFHAIYLINLATPDDQKFNMARLSLVNYLDLLDRIGGAGVIVHVGSLKDQDDEAVGYDRVVSAINLVMDRAPGSSRLILEVAAGAGQVIGDRLEELAEIHSMLERKERVGFGLDTQHMWASGYDFVNDYENVLKQIGDVFTFDRVWSVHLNDSKTALASRKDRHENLGDGLIGREALAKVLRDERLAHVPFILETPALESIEGAKGEVAKVREILGVR